MVIRIVIYLRVTFAMMVRLVLPKEIVGVFSHHSLPDGV